MDEHTLWRVVVVSGPLAGMALQVIMGMDLNRFLRRVHGALRDDADLELLRQAIGRQMVAALVLILLQGGPLVMLPLGLAAFGFSITDLLFFILPQLACLGAGLAYRKAEREAKTLPAADPRVLAVRDALVRAWVTRPLPPRRLPPG